MSPRLRFTRPDVPILNWDSPQAQGLRALFLPSTARPRDLVTGLSLNAPALAEPTPAGDPVGGVCLDLNASGAGVYTTAPVQWQLQPPCTILLGVRRLGTMGGNVTLAGGFYNLPQTSPYVTWGFFESSANVDYIGMYANSGGVILAPTGGTPDAPLPLNEYHIWVGVFDVNAQRLYRDGVLVASGSVGHTNTQYTATSTWGFGDPNGVNGNPSIRVSHAGLWARALSPAEIWALYDPATRWDLCWQRRRTFFIPAGGGGSFNPAWAAGSNVILGATPC